MRVFFDGLAKKIGFDPLCAADWAVVQKKDVIEAGVSVFVYCASSPIAHYLCCMLLTANHYAGQGYIATLWGFTHTSYSKCVLGFANRRKKV
jgi:hypothetical protein